MHFVSKASEANVSPRLLGNYEAELHPLIEQIISDNFQHIVDIGCADGYYACGFAYRMPEVHIAAFDINPKAQDLCRSLCLQNGVADRITIAGEFQGKDFELFADKKSLVFIDAEGAEDALLRPDEFSALQKLYIVVECHDVFKPGLSTQIASRFATTHNVRRIEPQLHSVPLPAWFAQMGHLDQLLAIWEWRMGATPWLVLTPR